MLQKKTIILISSLVIISLLGLSIFLFFSDKKEQRINEKIKPAVTEKTSESTNGTSSQNKYYYVYLKQRDSNSDTSFIPEKLNPGYDMTESHNTTIEYNADGSIIEDDKIIVVYNYIISEKNRKKIKEIAGEQKYAEALKEIQERIDEAKARDTNSN